MSLPNDYYYGGMDLANIQAIKKLCLSIGIKDSPLQVYRAAILQLARDAENECYKLIEEYSEREG